MESVGIAKIQLTNPMLASYVKRINSWDEEGKFQIVKDDQVRPFYAIYLDDQFLGASIMQFDSETANVNISMINGSNQNYDRIEKESTKQLTDIALANYATAKTVNVRQVKKLGTVK